VSFDGIGDNRSEHHAADSRIAVALDAAACVRAIIEQQGSAQRNASRGDAAKRSARDPHGLLRSSLAAIGLGRYGGMRVSNAAGPPMSVGVLPLIARSEMLFSGGGVVDARPFRTVARADGGYSYRPHNYEAR
jgi:hypothetical protein